MKGAAIAATSQQALREPAAVALTARMFEPRLRDDSFGAQLSRFMAPW